MTPSRPKVTIKSLSPLLLALLPVSQVLAHGMSEADKQSMLEGNYLVYVKLGASHMLTGYDHLLFLFGVIFFLTRFKDIVKFITAFTLGHSITLISATFMEITANYFLVDAVIALTVLYKGFDNIDGFQKYLKMKSPNLLFLVFTFGLIHGFGLSTRLQQLPLGDQGLLLKIISFNVGVELGQVIALTIMLFVLAGWRRTPSFERFSTVSNVGLMIAGVLLFLMQMHGYSHEAMVDDLAFSKASHAEAHLSMSGGESSVPAESGAAGAGASPRSDTTTVTIPGASGKEYKLNVEKGATLEYSWDTDGAKLYYDLHAEPAGDTTGKFESFEKGTESEASGTVTAPFKGTYGWYWKNSGLEPVKVSLRTKGTYTIRLALPSGLGSMPAPPSEK